MKERRIKRLEKRAKRATKRGNIKRATRLTSKAETITKRKVRSDKAKEKIRKEGINIPGPSF